MATADADAHADAQDDAASMRAPRDTAAIASESATGAAGNPADASGVSGAEAVEGGRRRGRGRDRYRREARGADVGSGAEAALEPTTVETTGAAGAAEVGVETVPQLPPSAPTPQLAEADLASLPAALETLAPVEASAATVEPYVLPLDELLRIAEGSGLQWISSDADKIRAAQQALASEPPPVRVPRVRKPAPQLESGPLVLVETRKDLSQMKLPFDAAPAGAAQEVSTAPQ